MIDNRLLPCPFCGAPARMWRTNHEVFIECSKYHVKEHRIDVVGKTEEEAIKRWNQRDGCKLDIVKCGDCKLCYGEPDKGAGECLYTQAFLTEDDYCSFGERKEES